MGKGRYSTPHVRLPEAVKAAFAGQRDLFACRFVHACSTLFYNDVNEFVLTSGDVDRHGLTESIRQIGRVHVIHIE